MKKIFTFIFLSFFIPTISFAAFDDVTLTTSTIISVGGYALNVQGSSSVVESITVDTNSFAVTLLSGSSFSISSATKAGFGVNTAGATVTSTITCSTPSVLTLDPSGTATVTITPSGTCTATSSSPVSSGGGGGSVSLIVLQAMSNALRTEQNINIQPPTVLNIFTSYIKFQTRSEQVKMLQQFLNTHSFIVSTEGAGSKGKETTYFGPATKKALTGFQKANRLTPDGIFGSKTRAVMNILTSDKIGIDLF